MAKNIKPGPINDICLYRNLACKWTDSCSTHKISLATIGERTLSQHIYLMIQKTCSDLVTMRLLPSTRLIDRDYRMKRNKLARLSSVLKEIDCKLHKTLVYDPLMAH